MSKKRKTKLTPQKTVRIGLTLLLIVGVLFIVKEMVNHYVKEQKDSFPETSQEEGQTKEKKENKKTEEKTEDLEQTEETKAIQNFDGEDPNKKAELTGVITTTRISDNNLIIRVEIDQFLTSGTCDLVLSKEEKTYSENVSIFADASTSTCEGFNIPVSKLENGNWKIKIRLSSNDKAGQIEGEANI